MLCHLEAQPGKTPRARARPARFLRMEDRKWPMLNKEGKNREGTVLGNHGGAAIAPASDQPPPRRRRQQCRETIKSLQNTC